ncbi:MAG: TerB family tellurite resistance protein [Arcobacteraceae bacterium]|nr:TerB family tellurite resistance protein [Arcobacteraceae bacterium]
MLDSAQEKISEGLEKAVNSVKNERAEAYKKNGNPSIHHIDSLISNYSNTNAAISGGAGLIPGPLGMAATIPEIIAVTRNQMAMIHDIGAAHNQNKEVPKELIIGVMLSASGSAATSLFVIQGQKIMAKRVGARALQQVIKILGGKITQQMGKSMVAKYAPFIGAVVMAGWSRYSTQKIGEEAKDFFSKYEVVYESEEVIETVTVDDITVEETADTKLTKLKIQILINMLQIDGTIDQKEIDFVTSFINKTDLSESDKNDLIKQIETKTVKEIDYTVFKNNQTEAMYLIIDLVALAKADGVFHEAEKVYVKELGTMFNIKDDVINMWIQ